MKKRIAALAAVLTAIAAAVGLSANASRGAVTVHVLHLNRKEKSR